MLHEIGGPGQQRLRAARILVVGAGGLGSPALLYLAAAGVGTLGIVDDDAVALSNLQRQVLHATPEIGARKVDSAARALARLNPHVAVETHAARLDAALAAELVPRYDLVLDGSDNFATRYARQRRLRRRRPPARRRRHEPLGRPGRRLRPGPRRPLLRLRLSRAAGRRSWSRPAPRPGSSARSPGVMGSMMAVEAVKLVTGAGTPLRAALLLYDALDGEVRRIRAAPQPGCRVCGGRGAAE